MFRIHRESRDDKKKEKIQRLISFPCEPRCPIALPVFYEGGEHVGQTKEIALLYTDIAVSCRLPQVEHSLVEILDLVLKQHLWHLLSNIRCDNLWNDLFHLESSLVSKTTRSKYFQFVFKLCTFIITEKIGLISITVSITSEWITKRNYFPR